MRAAVGDEFMIIIEGEAEVSQGGRTIATLGRGDLVGEMALLHHDGRGRRNATVTTATDMVIYAGSPSEFRQILDAAPSVAEKMSPDGRSGEPCVTQPEPAAGAQRSVTGLLR